MSSQDAAVSQTLSIICITIQYVFMKAMKRTSNIFFI